jgi:hypothetical protein
MDVVRLHHIGWEQLILNKYNTQTKHWNHHDTEFYVLCV